MSLRSKQGLKAFTQEYEQEQAQRREQALAPIHQQVTKVALLEQQVAEAEKDIARQEAVKNLFTTEDNPELAKRIPAFNPTPYEKAGVTTMDDIGKLMLAAFSEAVEELQKRGIKLSKAWAEKVVQIRKLNTKLDFLQPVTYVSIFDYMSEIGANESLGVTVPEPEPVQTRQPEPLEVKPELTVSQAQRQVEKCETLTRQGEKDAKYFATVALCVEAKPIATAFFNRMAKKFGKTYTDKERQDVTNWLRRQNLNLSNPASWEIARVKFLNVLTHEEEQAVMMDKDAETMSAREFAKRWGVRIGGAQGF